jgi:hypothetical protein
MKTLNIITLRILGCRDIVEAVGRRLPEATVRLRVRASEMGFIVDKARLGDVFFRVLRFPLPIIHPTHCSTIIIIILIIIIIIIINQGWYNRPMSGLSNNGFGSTLAQ